MEERQSELERKYHTLALEYSKIRSQATVLKKAVLDEQNKNSELKESTKNTEQQLRKRDQEIDSLTFRNEQLTKRISVLQQELQSNNHGKKSKGKIVENAGHFNISIVDEELHKKIMENAELVSMLADRDLEFQNSKEQIGWLEQKLESVQNELSKAEEKHQYTLGELTEKQKKLTIQDHKSTSIDCTYSEQQGDDAKSTFIWQEEAERWKAECELLRSKPSSNSELSEYYESQLRQLLDSNQMVRSETKSLEAENMALAARLEQIIIEKNHLQTSILTNADELNTTSSNYKIQLDAMTEHLAAQNETITKQCDEIQALKHQLLFKK